MNTNTDKFIKIEIVDDASLLQACDYLHDASFDISTLKVDIDKGIWRGIFNREYFEDPDVIIQKSIMPLVKRWTYPLISAELSLEGVVSYGISDQSKIGRYCFNECQIVKNEYNLVFCESMEMTIRFTGKPCGKFIDLGLTGKSRNAYSLGKLFPFSFCKN